MSIVKRYPNRKLYDTAARRYVSLKSIAEMIRRGETVQVVDNATGEDQTTLILTQIIMEHEKRGDGYLPLEVLTGLIQAGGSTLTGLWRRLNTSLDLLRQVDEEIQARIEHMVGRGELAEEEGRRLGEKLAALGPGPRSSRVLEEVALENALRARGLPTRDDLSRLASLLDQLSEKVDRHAAGPRLPSEQATHRQREAEDQKRHADDRADNGERQGYTGDHKDETDQHSDEPSGHLDDASHESPEGSKRP